MGSDGGGLYALTLGLFRPDPLLPLVKTSKRFKKAEYIEDYKLQTAAYAVAHDEMFDSDIQQGVLLIGTRPNDEYKVPPKVQKVIIPKKELDQYRIKWMDVLEDFHAGRL